MDVCKALDLDVTKLNEYGKDDIKQKYKKIALECHPDKLNNIDDDAEKSRKIERFKQASMAYKIALEDLDKYGKIVSDVRCDDYMDYDFSRFKEDFEIYKDFDVEFWSNTIDMLKDKEFLKNTFSNIASFFLNNNFHTKKYYQPSSEDDVIKHNIVLPIRYNDLLKKSKKKLRLVLKGVEDPVFLDIYCKKEYPRVVRQYLDDDGCEHEIDIQMKLGHDAEVASILDIYSHIEKDDGSIDLITSMGVTWLEYIVGGVKQLQYVDDGYIDINLKAFCLDQIIIAGKGLLGGNLIINLYIINIQEKEWKNLDEVHKRKMLSALKMI